MLTEAVAADTVSVIACPVDYSENLRLTGTLGELSRALLRTAGTPAAWLAGAHCGDP